MFANILSRKETARGITRPLVGLFPFFFVAALQYFMGKKSVGL